MISLIDKFRNFFGKRTVFWSIIGTLSLNYYIWYIINYYIDFSKSSHVLHYNVYFGIDLLGSPLNLFFAPVIGLLVFLVNLIFSFYIYNPKKNSLLLSYFLLYTSLFINLELVMYIVLIVGI